MNVKWIVVRSGRREYYESITPFTGVGTPAANDKTLRKRLRAGDRDLPGERQWFTISLVEDKGDAHTAARVSTQTEVTPTEWKNAKCPRNNGMLLGRKRGTQTNAHKQR